MLLSILTCHLPDRRQMLARLMRRLVPQCVPYGGALNWEQLLEVLLRQERLELGQVEWLIDATPKSIEDEDAEGGMRTVTTGEKRNGLMALARGRWCAHVDDDDLVSIDYCQRILFALQSDPDVVGMEGTLFRPGQKQGKLFVHSLNVASWHETPEAYWRTPNHLNPIRRELALRAGFTEKVFGEDKDFSDRVLPLLKTEVYLKKPIYEYHCR